MEDKRQRSANFSTEEKFKVIQIIKTKSDILISKKNDGATNKAKEEAWEDVTCLFNGCNPVKRSATSLKKMFHKLKSEARVYMMNQLNCASAGIAGISSITEDTIMEEVLDIIGRSPMPLTNIYDSDAGFIASDLDLIKVEPITLSPTKITFSDNILSSRTSPTEEEQNGVDEVIANCTSSLSRATSGIARRRLGLKKNLNDSLLHARIKTEKMKCELLETEKRKIVQDIEIRDILIKKIKNNEEVQSGLVELLKYK